MQKIVNDSNISRAKKAGPPFLQLQFSGGSFTWKIYVPWMLFFHWEEIQSVPGRKAAGNTDRFRSQTAEKVSKPVMQKQMISNIIQSLLFAPESSICK